LRQDKQEVEGTRTHRDVPAVHSQHPLGGTDLEPAEAQGFVVGNRRHGVNPMAPDHGAIER